MYPIIATVDYLDDLDLSHTMHSCFLLYAEDLHKALLQVEDYVGQEDITSITLSYASGSDVLFEVPDSIAKILLRGDANYSDGLQDTMNTPQNSQE